MERRKYLQIPGPTNIPSSVLNSLSKPIINHRGKEFEKLVAECVSGLKDVLKTKNDVLMFPSSGSGILESAIVNLFSPGDKIAAVCHGVFSERMADIGESHGLEVTRINVEWGKAVKKEDILVVLDKDEKKELKAICLPHNETTSGITNDLEDITKAIKSTGHPALIIVDSVSGLACMPLETDKWGIDIVAGGSQKGLMLPPGIGLVSISKKAWELADKATMDKWYWDYKPMKERMEINQFRYTPPTNILFGLKESLELIKEEGLENVLDRHKYIGDAVRYSAKAMGLKLFAEEGYESNSVTAIELPEGVEYKKLASILEDKYNVIIGGGLRKLSGKIFRIGHLGSIFNTDIYAVMGAVEMALYEAGYKVELGTAGKALGELFTKNN